MGSPAYVVHALDGPVLAKAFELEAAKRTADATHGRAVVVHAGRVVHWAAGLDAGSRRASTVFLQRLGALPAKGPARRAAANDNTKEKPVPTETKKTCAQPDCAEAPAPVAKHTPPGTEELCARHRKLECKRRSNAKARAAKGRAKKPQVRQAAKVARVPQPRRTRDLVTETYDLVGRALRVIGALGGIERAERIAEAVGGGRG